VLVLTGAGVSAESGIATFREAQSGLWSRYDPETLASAEGFARNPGLVWRWYMDRFGGAVHAQPNAGHSALARLETLDATLTLVTQNVDDLHERAGSSRVLHLHGSLGEFRCSNCARPHLLADAERYAPEPPRCATCHGYVRPGVVWFGELLPEDVLEGAWQAARRCDLCLVVGTSGVVYPAAALPEMAQRSGALVVEVNTERSELSPRADIVLIGRSGQVLPALEAAAQRANGS
jgi:NAD-dependent deacetylase